MMETQRLVIRPPELRDFDDLYSMWSDPQVVQFVTGAPLTREEVWTRLLRSIGHWAALGFGHWIVSEKSNAAFVGEVGFVQHRRGISPAFDASPEIGWMIAQRAQRFGYASEAIAAALNWAHTRWPGAETVCIISPENAASMKVANRFDYRPDHETTYKNKVVSVCRRAPGHAG
ncbi:GNAT family N-acetyltransferase [Paraburkholderia sp.]|uniref:GNAT family N-acetyltransferase n=1 Tax=Paraburkholderia sp. TaxID=1926495 RepID=UPI00286EC963|nr:GNAT family N-acetyltransferase [Paraburkholderia sp.]